MAFPSGLMTFTWKVPSTPPFIVAGSDCSVMVTFEAGGTDALLSLPYAFDPPNIPVIELRYVDGTAVLR